MKGKLLAPLYDFAKYGGNGMWVSDTFPHLSQQTDHLCMLNGMTGPSSVHPIAIPMMHTGEFQFVRPSFGSWVLYGLGTDNQNLPGFITIKPTRTFGGPANYGSAFLPSTFQATRLGWQGQPIKNASISNLKANHGLTTEALGYKTVEGEVHLYDLHATMLHLLGLDHTKLVYRFSGRDFRLSYIHRNVIHDISS